MTGVGDRIEVRLRKMAHGGVVLAGIVGDERTTVFVRHGLPGESGAATVTGVRSGGRIVFADLIEVHRASPDRVVPGCPVSGPGGCGGCDLQHVALAAQRRLKAEVIADSLRRTAGLEPAEIPWDGIVHAVPGDEHGLRWRTRSRFVSQSGGLAMRGWRSRDLIHIEDCPIAEVDVVTAAAEVSAPGEVAAAATSTGEVVAGPVAALAGERVHERVGEHLLEVSATGFWQVHPGAPQVLTDAVAAALGVRADDVLLDLYGGVGLFAAVLGPQAGRVIVVEGDRSAVASARRNLRHLTAAQVHRSPVDTWLAGYRGSADAVVLDPPRAGAGAAVLKELHRLRPRAVAYVACDPVALARDLRTVIDLGWRLVGIQAFDMFPMTHHVECVVALQP